jgi:hypothetical protein
VRNEVNKICGTVGLVLMMVLFMKYTVEMASDSMIYVPSFMKIDLGTQNPTFNFF